MRTRMIWLGVVGVVVLTLGAVQLAIDRETVGGLDQRNPGGDAGHALLVYHPGLSDLQRRLTNAFAEGLVQNGWRVTLTTTSRAAPADLAPYDLLVLGVHTYWWAPDGPTRRYLARLGDLQNKPVVALLSALGSAGRAKARTETLIREAGGRVVTVQPFFVLRPNLETDPRPNLEVALTLARDLGRTVGARP